MKICGGGHVPLNVPLFTVIAFVFLKLQLFKSSYFIYAMLDSVIQSIICSKPQLATYCQVFTIHSSILISTLGHLKLFHFTLDFLNAAKYNERCFALSYVLYIKSPKEIYLHKMPYIREAKEKHTPLAMLNEYDTASILTDIPDQYNFKSNEKGDFAVFIKALEEISNKYSLGKSWKNVEDNIVESVAALLGAVKSSIVPLIGKNSFGLLGLDFILDNNLRPYFIGLSHIPYFADEVVLKDVISVLLCCDTSKGLPSGTSFFKLTCG